MLKTVMLRSALIAFACALSVTVHAYAADPKRVDVPPGDLTVALETLAKQSGVELVYQTDQLKGLRTRGVTGNFSPEEAVTKLLEGTKLTLKTDSSGAMLIAPPKLPLSSLEEREGPAELEGEVLQGGTAERRVRLSQAEKPSPGSASDNPSPSKGEGKGEDQGQELPAPEEKGKAVPEILIKGSRSLNTDIQRTEDDAQPYVTFDHQAIERSGAPNIESFLKQRLPMSTDALSASQSQGAVNLSRVNLRGLGTTQTLILIDGHRVASGYVSGGTPIQPDINAIPVGAVERIEVLPTTASGIYGGSATGGVVNIVLRRNYSGLDTQILYDNTFEGDSTRRRVDVSGGVDLEDGRTNLMFAASYADARTLAMEDRDFIERYRSSVVTNNPSFFSSGSQLPLGGTTNIRNTVLVGGVRQNLVLKSGNTPLPSSITFVPAGYAGPASDGGLAFIANAGRYNLNPANTMHAFGGDDFGLVTGPTVKSLLLTARREFTPRVTLFLDAIGSESKQNFPSSFDFRSIGVTLPATAPNNPFTTAVQVSVPNPAASGYVVSSNKNHRLVGGIIVRLPAEWVASADYTWNRFRWEFQNGPALSAAAAAAMADGTLDVMRDINIAPLDFSPFAPYLVSGGNSLTPFRSTFEDATIRASGPTFSLPGGRVVLTGLVERRRENYPEASEAFPAFGVAATVYPSRSQSVDSVYAEARVPLVSAQNARTGIRELDLQVAARYDRYTVNGVTGSYNPITTPNPVLVRVTNENTSVDPTFSLRYQPTEDLTLRASYGTGFLPPAVTHLTPLPSSITLAGNVADPKRGGEQVILPFGQLTISGNPDLEPEQSETWSAGAIFTPRFAPDLRVSVDYTRIKKTDNIGGVSSQQLLNELEDTFPERVTRGANQPGDLPGWPGRITAMNVALINLGGVEVEAIDAAVDYRLETSRAGTFDFFALGTWQTKFETKRLASEPVVDNVGFPIDATSIPIKFRGNAGITWHGGSWSLGWTARYFHSYFAANPSVPFNATILLNQGNGGRVPSQIFHDVLATYRFESGPDILNGLETRIGIRNVFNTRPPLDANDTIRAYSGFGDPRQASYYVSLSKAFR